MELVRACISERRSKQPVCSTGVDTRRAKGKREAKDYVENDSQTKGAGWKRWSMAKRAEQNGECWSHSVMALCAY